MHLIDTLLAVVMFASLVIFGCAVSPYQHCEFELNGKNVFLVNWPENRDELLDLVKDKFRSYDANQLKDQNRTEVWFSTPSSKLTVCRYDNVHNSCSDFSTTVSFYQSNGNWEASDVMVSMCIADP